MSSDIVEEDELVEEEDCGEEDDVILEPIFARPCFKPEPISTDKKTTLNKALSKRMNRDTFRSKFMPRHRTSVAERGEGLASLLANRPNASALKRVNVIKEGQMVGKIQAQAALLKKAKLQDMLNQRIAQRPTKDVLIRGNIMQDETTSMGLTKAAVDSLNQRLAQRPTKDVLIRGNIIKHTGSASSRLHAKSAQLQKAQLTTKLNSLVAARPDKATLEDRGIIVPPSVEDDKAEEKNAAKQALLGFLASRPTPQELVKQKVLADIGGLPGMNRASTLVGAEHKPHMVPGITNAVQVHTGFAHTAVLDTDGQLWTFGRADRTGHRTPAEGEQLDGPSTPKVLQQLKDLGTVSCVSVGDNHTAAIVDGTLYTWGQGAWGRLGLGGQEDVFEPTAVVFPEAEIAVGVVCGSYHTVVTTEAGNTYAFGWNKGGCVGCGPQPTAAIDTPFYLAQLSGPDSPSIVQMAAGQGFTLCVMDDGAVYSWGSGSWGHLGHGNSDDQIYPTQILAIKDVSMQSVCAGSSHSLAVASDGSVWSWGQGNQSQLGFKSDTLVSVPTKIPKLLGTDTSRVAAGQTVSFFTDKDGALHAWGKQRGRGTLGLGQEEAGEPTRVGAIKDPVISVAAAWTHCACATQDGAVFTWGAKQWGKLGH